MGKSITPAIKKFLINIKFILMDWKDPMEKEMATHSSILACKVPWTEKPGSLQSMESQRVEHD